MCKTVFLSQTCNRAYSGKVEFIEGSYYLFVTCVLFLEHRSILLGFELNQSMFLLLQNGSILV